MYQLLIFNLYYVFPRWAAIATHLSGRTDNDVKNFWNSHLRKRFDSKVLEPSSSSKSVDTKSGSSISHMVQWESVRLEAESRLSSTPGNNTKGDYFLNLWNSKVGESFRNINESCTNECGGGAATHSPTSQSSSLTKVESASLTEPCKTSSPVEMNDHKVELWSCKKESEEVAALSNTSKSYEIDDSSDAMLKLLLDFPVGGNDMAFLEAPPFDVSTYSQN